MLKKKKFAGLDFDKTVWKDYSIWQSLDFLEDAGIVDEKLRTDLQMITDWKNAGKDNLGGRYTYDMVCHDYGTMWAKTMTGVPQDAVVEASEKMINEKYDESIYSATPELVELLQKNDYDVVFVSLAPIEILRPVAKRLGIETILAFEMIATNGVYTGLTKTNIHHPGGKGIELGKLKASGNYDWKNSIAFDDSPNGLSMLGKVDIGVILNPTDGMDKPENRNGHTVLYNSNVIPGVTNLLNANRL
ncbi:MAG: haloacid dehalogenase-like hydrolase [archaeon]